MGMKTALFLILIILAAGYVYYTNPHIIDELTKKADTFKGKYGESGQSETSESGTPTQSPSEKGFSGKGWAGANGSDVYIGKDFGAIRVNSTYVLFLDRNRDGVIDAVYLDTTGDGNYDTRYLDQDYNGKTDEWITTFNGVKSYAWDITGDGIADIYDSNGDGKIDAWDINSDGVIDERDVDYDGNPDLHDYDFDGVFDEFQGGPVLAPPNESAETGTLCAPTKDEAYHRFVAAYNNVTSLQQANASSEELKKAYAVYLKAKACYESFSENSTTTAVEGELGDTYEAVLSTEGDMALKFSTGKTVAEWSSDWSKVDVRVEPWCVDYPALLGHYIDLGKKDLEDLTMSEIPKSGYPESEVGEEIKLGHVYVNRNSDGTYTAFEVVSHKKIGDCGHKIVIAYRNIRR
ncbi:calcium-binding protein [Thermococcus sp.]